MSGRSYPATVRNALRSFAGQLGSMKDFEERDAALESLETIVSERDAANLSLATCQAALSGTQHVRDDYKYRAETAERHADENMAARDEMTNEAEVWKRLYEGSVSQRAALQDALRPFVTDRAPDNPAVRHARAVLGASLPLPLHEMQSGEVPR